MLLPLDEVEQFFRLHQALMFFVNERLKVIDEKPATPEAYSELPPATRFKVHKAFLEHVDLIDGFVAENPSGFDEDDLEIVRSWRHLVTGTFYAFRQLRGHMIFLSTTDPVVAYGVLALFNPFEDLIGTDLPRMVDTTLLPFKGRIVYDGLASGYNVSFGSGVRRRLVEEYNEAKANPGIITSLPPPRSHRRPSCRSSPRRSRRREPGPPGAGPRSRRPRPRRATGSSP